MVVRYHFRKLRSTSDFAYHRKIELREVIGSGVAIFSRQSQEFKRRSGGQHEISKRIRIQMVLVGLGAALLNGRLGSRTTGHGIPLTLTSTLEHQRRKKPAVVRSGAELYSRKDGR